MIDMKLFARLLTFAFVICVLFAFVSGQRKERILESWQPTHYDIAIVFDNSLSTIKATTRIDVVARQNDVRTIDLDFGSMPVSSVSVNNTSARFDQHNEKLDVHLNIPAQKGQRLSITVNYSGAPKDGLILTRDRDGNPSAIGDNWPDRVHHWIPSFDHPSAKASVRFSVTAPSANTAVANGVPVSTRQNGDGTKTWIFNEERPVSPYNMVVAVGHFATATISGKNRIPVTYYVPMSEGKFAAKGFSAAVPSVATFSNLVAPYPYKKLALIVGATRFGGMENANTIVFSPNYFGNFLTAPKRSKRFGVPTGLVSVDAHEIAHQWFGDSVTESTWSDLWLSEGFATYFAGLFFERAEGRAAFDEYMRDQAKSYFEYEKKRRAPIHDTQTEKLFDLLNANNYEKGAWVLHMLRRMLGDKAFFAGIKNYYAQHKDSTATTEDLRASLEKSSGKDLRAFFDRWIYKAGHPTFKANWRDAGRGMIEITLTQTQDDEAFLQPVTVEVVYKTGKRRLRIVPTGKEAKITVRSPKPERIVVDPEESILKEIAN
jgi:aminopeptidase N